MLLLSLVAWAAFAATADAGEVTATPGSITYRAAPGEANFFTVNWGREPGSLPFLTDHAPIGIGTGCEDFGGGVAVTCSAAGPDPAIVVYLGDGNDFAQSINDRAVGHSVTFYGEDGDDDLDSDGSADVLDGGPGNDLLTPDDRRSPDRATWCAAGRASTRCRPATRPARWGRSRSPSTTSPTTAIPARATTTRATSRTSPPRRPRPPIHFTGNDGPNDVQLRSEAADIVRGLGGNDRIDGANGNDQLDGGAGDDTILGGGGDDVIVGGPGTDSLAGEGSGSGQFTSVPGNDTIDARDGVREQLNCGPGADTAIVDALDLVPQDPGSLCEAVQRPPVIAAAKLSTSSLKVQSRKRVTVKLTCPKDVAPCAGKLTLKRGKVTLGSAKYAVAAGKSKRVRVNLTSKGRRWCASPRRCACGSRWRPRAAPPRPRP